MAINTSSFILPLKENKRPPKEQLLETSNKRLEKNKSDFLKLFTTQLKYQSPTNPMDAATMYNNIAQLNMVEQNLENNKLLSKIHQLLEEGNFNSAYTNLMLNDIYKNICNSSNEIEYDSGLKYTNDKVEMRYIVPENSTKIGILEIENEFGIPVYIAEINAHFGPNTFYWDGIDMNGNKLTNLNSLRYKVTLLDQDGNYYDALIPQSSSNEINTKMQRYKQINDKLIQDYLDRKI